MRVSNSLDWESVRGEERAMVYILKNCNLQYQDAKLSHFASTFSV